MTRIRRASFVVVASAALTLACLLLTYSTFFAGTSSTPVEPSIEGSAPSPSRGESPPGIRGEVGEDELTDQSPSGDSVPKPESENLLSTGSLQWLENVRALSRAEQVEILAELETRYEDLIRPECEQRLREGQYLVVGYGAEWKDYYWEETEVMKLYFFGEGKPIRKVILPRGEFPEAYELHDRIAWCRKLIGRE